MTAKIKIIIGIIIVIILGALSGTFYLYRQFDQPNSQSEDRVILEIKAGSISNVSKALQTNGLLKESWVFDLYSRMADKEIYAGYYNLPKNLTPKELFESLTKEDYRVYIITIPEGYRTEQIAQKLETNEIVSYDNFLAAAKGKEGYLFPDTYFFKKNDDPKSIVGKMEADFETQTKDLSVKKSDLILASIVERETAGDDRSIIAGIYKNRLNINMKLDADPTVQYAKDSNSIENMSADDLKNFKFWRSITSKDYYAVDSLYNAYTNVGLPPGPICNPGLKSIQAALNPDKNNYIYFFHVDGQIYPSKTLEEHNQKKKQYLY